MSLFDALLEDGLADSLLDPTESSRDIYLAIRSDASAGTGTPADPFNGSGTRFDAIMAGLVDSGRQTIHLGPGVFLTQGAFKASWTPWSGHRILGSGINATTLKLQLALVDPSRVDYCVFERTDATLTGYEISDLTIDCNLTGQPNSLGYDYPRISVAAILLRGSNILIRRVRVINFGTRTPFWDYGEGSVPTSRECFPIAVGHAIPPSDAVHSNCVVEDCMVEQPAVNNARETTCINLFGRRGPGLFGPTTTQTVTASGMLPSSRRAIQPFLRKQHPSEF